VKAREWHERGRNAPDPIEGFSNSWRAFNNLFFRVIAANERDKIMTFLRDRISQLKATELIGAHDPEVKYLLSQPVIDMRGNGRDTKSNIEAFHAATDSLVKLQQLFMVIYQVRCNLEHGQKSPTRERDVQLCRSALPILTAVVGLCI